MLLVTNGTLYTPSGTIPEGEVLMEGGTIRQVGRRGEVVVPPGARRIDAAGGHIAPGFIDIHMHGALGRDLMNSGPDEFACVTAYLPQTGVTSFVPAVITAPFLEIRAALDRGRDVMARGLPGAVILGLHVEGPYLNVEQRGAHRPDCIHAPEAAEWAALLDYEPGIIRWVTLAPEEPGALDLVAALSARGIMVSAGHTMAIERDLEPAIAAGLRHVTHLYGNMSTLRRDNLTRVAGVVETALGDDRLTSEIIGDGYHISPTLMKLAYRCKGPDRLAIVTDASPLMGMPSGRHQVWGIVVVVDGERCFLPDRSAFAGSVVPMNACVRKVVERTGISLADGIRMASATPAAILGIGDRKGSIVDGMDADVVVLDRDLDVACTVIGGQVCYSRGGAAHV